MPTLDSIAGGGPLENAARTPHEDAVMSKQVADDIQALELAEAQAIGLRRGESRWSCPGCHMSWVGVQGGHQYLAFKQHIKRHAHARPMRGMGEEVA